MKKMIFFTLILIELSMSVLTFLVFNSEKSEYLFQGGSVVSTMKMFSPNFWIVLVLYVLTILSTILFAKRFKTLLVSFLVLFSLWFLSGRTLGVHWTGELTKGWFYLSSGKVYLPKNNDCLDDIMECNTALNSFFWYLKIVNGNNEEKVFVGPLLRSDMRNYFNQKE